MAYLGKQVGVQGMSKEVVWVVAALVVVLPLVFIFCAMGSVAVTTKSKFKAKQDWIIENFSFYEKFCGVILAKIVDFAKIRIFSKPRYCD